MIYTTILYTPNTQILPWNPLATGAVPRNVQPRARPSIRIPIATGTPVSSTHIVTGTTTNYSSEYTSHTPQPSGSLIEMARRTGMAKRTCTRRLPTDPNPRTRTRTRVSLVVQPQPSGSSGLSPDPGSSRIQHISLIRIS